MAGGRRWVRRCDNQFSNGCHGCTIIERLDLCLSYSNYGGGLCSSVGAVGVAGMLDMCMMFTSDSLYKTVDGVDFLGESNVCLNL